MQRWLVIIAVLSGTPTLAAGAGDSALRAAEGRLIGGAPIGGGGAAGFAQGPVLEVDVGAAIPIRVDPHQEAEAGLAFGAAVGYQFANGLEPFVAYHLLGTSPQLIDDTDLRALGFGARYSIPFIAPSPFFELMVGPAFVEERTLVDTVAVTRFGGSVGLGCSFQLGRFFSLGLAARYWLIDGPRGLLQALGLQAQVNANFGMLFRK